jgi:hypothetical protein
MLLLLFLTTCASLNVPSRFSQHSHGSRCTSSTTSPSGVNDLLFYQTVAPAFVGLNPVSGNGSGFLIRDLKNSTFGTAPSSNTGRNHLCTCDCKPGADGVGCVGWGGTWAGVVCLIILIELNRHQFSLQQHVVDWSTDKGMDGTNAGLAKHPQCRAKLFGR